MSKKEYEEKISCAICEREFYPNPKPKVTVGGYACTPEAAKTMGIEQSGIMFAEICPECYAKEELKGGRDDH